MSKAKMMKAAPDAGESLPFADCDDPWRCPVHGIKVSVIRRKSGKEDEATQGAFYGCTKYSECGYYITSDLKRVARSKVIATQ